MSWKTHLAKIAVEFGEDIAGRVGRILGEDASENEARDTARRIQRTLAPEAARPAVRLRPRPADRIGGGKADPHGGVGRPRGRGGGFAAAGHDIASPSAPPCGR